MFGWSKSRKPSLTTALALDDIAEPAALFSALGQSVDEYLKQTDEGFLVYPAAKRALNDTDGNIRAIWEHTRLEACRYMTMVPRRDVGLLVDPARQIEMIDTYLRQKPHEDTVIEFSGAPADDYSVAIGAGFNWLGHCAILARAAPDKFRRTRRDFRHLAVVARRWWELDGAVSRCQQMLANHEVPPLMFYLIWQTFTRLAKEIAIASICGSSLDPSFGRSERNPRTTPRYRPQELTTAPIKNPEVAARLQTASDPTDLL